ncbi:MAG: nucleotide exchange factor GrpE [Chloroflexi bacterium]|jgi:molecular chaperone GrpE (heat shock protein)|nr:nucleotide exchange factor GrpE [Chloroflexota bacterium]
MSDRRLVWATLADLLSQVEQKGSAPTAGANGKNGAQLEKLEQEIRKLGKTQYKANMLTESQADRLQSALQSLQEQQSREDRAIEALIEKEVAAAKQEWLSALLPTLDGLDAAIANGQQYLAQRDKVAQSGKLKAEQTYLVSPADRAKLANWLDGLRMVRERLLSMLASEGVTPIPTVGHKFDPYQHVAVEKITADDGPPGVIAAEERRGYRTPGGVLRYAEVVVYGKKTESSKQEKEKRLA